jgi:trigger factor
LNSQVTVTDISQVKKELAIEVPALEVKAEIERAYDAFQRQAQIPGFRPGKVPRDMVKARFSGQAKEEAVKQLLPHALHHAIVDHQLKAIGEPDITEVNIDNENVLRFKATVEVLPDFELKEYKGLSVTKRVPQVDDKDINAFLMRFRESAARMVDVDVEERGAQPGDHVTVNLAGNYVNPVEAHEHEPLKSDGVTLELSAPGVQAEFNENLTGARPDEVRVFRVHYPEDFTSEGLRGKMIDFTATVVSVQQKYLPTLDNEFARQVSTFQTMEELTDEVRKNFAEANALQADQIMREALLEKLLEDYDFQVPSVMIESQTRDRLNRFAMELLQRGVPREYLEQMDWREPAAEARVMAVRDIRAALVIGRIGMAENVSFSQAEMDAEIEAIAAEHNTPVAEVRAALTKEDALSSIESRLNYNKALDLIVANANITVEEISAEQLAQEQAAQAADNALAAPSETEAQATQA